jgi:hypothetical protein
VVGALNSTHTKDNLLRRVQTRNAKCHFCCQSESVYHLYFWCTVCTLVWQVVLCVHSPKKDSARDMFGDCMICSQDLTKILCCVELQMFNKKVSHDPANVIYRYLQHSKWVCNFADLTRTHEVLKMEWG